jgi:hypothetical protein
MKTPTDKQLKYIDSLMEQHDRNGTLEDVIHEINPDDWLEEEDFMAWMRRQDVRRASEVIDILKENL